MLEEFTSTDLQRNPKPVYDSVKEAPVLIRRNGGNPMILMSKPDYLKLINDQKKK